MKLIKKLAMKIIVKVNFLQDIIYSNKKKGAIRNKILRNDSLCKSCTFTFNGSNNVIKIFPGASIIDTKFKVWGSGNRIIIGNNSQICSSEFWIEDNNGEINIGEGVTIAGNLHIASTEGANITIGSDCMLSTNVVIRSGDSHSLLNEEGERINNAEVVSIGKHCWIGASTTILKGVHLADGICVGTQSLVTHSFKTPNIIIAGNPAKIIKSNIFWCRERL